MNSFFTKHAIDPRFIQVCVDEQSKKVLVTDGGKHGSASHWYAPEEARQLAAYLLQAADSLRAPP